MGRPPYQDLLARVEQGPYVWGQMIEGLTSGLERKSVEPIAVMHGLERRNFPAACRGRASGITTRCESSSDAR